jgi:anti-sigma28 factor (negative regulator of flagellin synthesis)
MMIDKVGGVAPGYGPGKKNDPVTRLDSSSKTGDNVVISEEASRAAEVARTSRLVLQSADSERAERLKEIKEKVARGDYNEVSDEQASKIAESLIGIFFRR